MSKIIFYADTHHGNIMEPLKPNSVRILGPKAVPMEMAMNAYANRNNYLTKIVGGDLATYPMNTQKPNHHYLRLELIRGIMKFYEGETFIANGNHDPTEFLKQFGFAETGLQDRSIKDAFNIMVCQAYGVHNGEKTVYGYDNKVLKKIFERAKFKKQIADKNLLVTGHYAFDRLFMGYPQFYPKNKGYTVEQNVEYITATLSEIEKQNPNSVLSLHGHEHRFRLTTPEQGFGFTCLTMPSIVQALHDDADTPCGFFAEIDSDPQTSKFMIEFKRIVLNEENPESSIVEDVSLEHLNKHYYRQFIPS